MDTSHDKDKILIEIAAYCDPDLLNTIDSALEQADHPDRLVFAICYQSDDLKTYHVLKSRPNCKINSMESAKAKGPCYARYLCQQLLGDEKYVFQIDSHMRFVRHWDSEMISQLLALKDPKATVSAYPPDLATATEFTQPARATFNAAKAFRGQDSYFIEFEAHFIDDAKTRPVKSPFIAAGNFFSFAAAHREVSHDPKMCWYGDELPMSIRYYTHGWNNYCPPQCFVYHKYCRKDRAIPNSYAQIQTLEERRLSQLLNLDHADHDMGQFGLGTERTLRQFEQYSGIDFTRKIIRHFNPNVV